MKYGFLKAFAFFILLSVVWAAAATDADDPEEALLDEYERRERARYHRDEVGAPTRTKKPLSREPENIEINTPEAIERMNAHPVPGELKSVPL